MVLEVIVVHSNLLLPDSTLNDESLARTNESLRLFANSVAPRIIMSGGPSKYTEQVAGGDFDGWYVPRKSEGVHSQLMAEYAKDQGIKKEVIAIQDFSRDTVGETIFQAGMVLNPHKFSKIGCVSSSYQIPRIKAIYERVYGKTLQVEFFPVEWRASQTIIDNEPKSLALFMQQFGDIEPGNIRKFHERLYNRHPLYVNTHPEGIPINERFFPETSPKREFGDLRRYFKIIETTK